MPIQFSMKKKLNTRMCSEKSRRMSVSKPSPLKLCFLLLTISIGSHLAFDDEINDDHTTETHHSGQLPKDKVLLRDVHKLVFLRNKRTTSRRTHSIHQLSCVGGTAGCKLFTPDVVECDKAGYNQEKSKFDWTCHADISERVRFNHVEVICEGYDYPEDDYILLGSCGLEFTLDYADPHDYHENSYFKQMDEHEKELHHERVRARQKPADRFVGLSGLLKSTTGYVTGHMVAIGIFMFLALCSIIIVRTFTTGKTGRKGSRVSSYGPLTSAVLNSEKKLVRLADVTCNKN